MEIGDLVGYAIAAIGIALIAWALWTGQRVNVNADIGNRVMRKLFEAHNHSRARKFASIAPGSYFVAVAAAITAAEASGSKERSVLEAAISPAFDTAATTLRRAWRGITERGLGGVIIVLGGAALAYSGGDLPIAHLVTSGLALLAAVWFITHRGSIDAALDTAKRELLPAIVASVMGASDEPPKRTDDTGPFRAIGIPKRTRKDAIASLRDQECPMCGPTTTRSIERDGGAFTVLVCTGCGYTQEFADLAKLTP